MKNARRKSELILAIAVLLVAGFWAFESAYAGRIVAWGWDYYGQCDAPAGDDFVAIAARWKHSLALKEDGSVVGWGQNNHGQSDSPPGDDYVAISAGCVHSLALTRKGSLVAWGYNGNGECNVPSGNDFVAISAGYYHNLALRSDGSITAWGNNYNGQCDVPDSNDFVAIAAGSEYSLALKADGSIEAWGRLDNRHVTYEPPEGNDFVAIAAGGFTGIHGLAIKTDGSIVAWGDNSAGQCNMPDGNDFMAIAAGAQHSVALKADGSVIAWGLSDDGQCDVPNVKGAIAIAAGSSHSLALFKEPPTGYPVADAGKDIVASANEQVTLDGSNSSDIDGNIVLYTWKRLPDGVVIYSGEEAVCRTRALGRAEEVIELTVTDNGMLTASDTAKIFNRMLYKLQLRIDGMKVSDLNQDREVNMVDFALLAEYWLR